MKILLISPNQVAFAHRITPIGLLYLATGLRKKGHQIEILDLMFSKKPQAAISACLERFKPALVGISLRTLDTMLTKGKSLLAYHQECFQTVKAHTKAITVLGGPGFTIAPEQLMQILPADYGLIGEADDTFPELIERLEKGMEIREIPGLIFPADKGFQNYPVLFNRDLNLLPFQAIDLVDIQSYRRKRGFIGVLTKRSCTQSCVFCDEKALYGKTVRLRPAESIVDEIAWIHKKTGMKYFDFADPLFNSPRHHMMNILENLLQRNIRIKFKVELNPIGQDEESVRLLKKAGCIGVDYSPDSGSDQMLLNYNKGFTRTQVLEVAGLYAKHHLPYSAGFLLGGPGENFETLQETIRLAKKLPKVNAVYFIVGLTMGGGNSEMEQGLQKKALTRADDLIEIKYFLEEGFDSRSAEALLELCRTHPGYYISETFTLPVLAPFWRISDWLNMRPIWKYGKLPSFALKVLKMGKDPLCWNEKSHRFMPC